jgi:hypothetical protein
LIGPAALGDGSGEGDVDGDVDGAEDAVDGVDFAVPDGVDLAVPVEVTVLGWVGGAPPEAVVVGNGAGLSEVGTEHAGAGLADAAFRPVERTTCTGSLRPPSCCAAVTPTRVTDWCMLLKIQRDSGAFAPFGYPFGSR